MGCGASSKAGEANPIQPSIGTETSTTSLKAVEEPVRANRASCVENDLIPEYWYNKKAKEQGVFDDMFYVQDSDNHKFDELFAHSYIGRVTQDRACPKNEHDRIPGGCPCNQPGADPGLPVAFRVQRVVRVESSSMWAKYQTKFADIKKRRGGSAGGPFAPPLVSANVTQKHKGLFAPLDSELNEVYSFHGTFIRYALSIAQNDFNIDLAGSNRGTLYGKGGYLAESITKADEYSKDEPGGYYAGVFAMLVCRVAMGKLYLTSDDQSAADKIRKGEFDSTCGQRMFRELVVYDAAQMYPEYVVMYKRVYKSDTDAHISMLLKRRFFMEVPLHWRNNTISLQDGFKEQHRGLAGINEFFQCLVNVSLGGPSHTVVLSSRVENSDLWKRYVDYKAMLRERLGGHEAGKADENSILGQVEKDIKDLTKWPCAFFAKGSCKHGEKCRFSHNEDTAKLSNVALAAGRRLPINEVDHQLNEHFLWYGGTKMQSVCMTKGSFDKSISNRKGDDASESFFEHLGDAFRNVDSSKGIKYACLCRIICGTPGDGNCASPKPGSRPSSDCTVSSTGDHADVTVSNPSQVYPEYVVELHSPEDEKAEEDNPEGGGEKPALSEIEAAIRIQKMARGWLARRRVRRIVQEVVLREDARYKLELGDEEDVQEVVLREDTRDISLPGLST